MTFCNSRSKCSEAGVCDHSPSALFKDFQQLQAIWTHPLSLKLKTYDSDDKNCDDSDFDVDEPDEEHSDEMGLGGEIESEYQENGELIKKTRVLLLLLSFYY